MSDRRGVNIEAGKDYWWCACGRTAKPALLRRVTQDGRLSATKIQRYRDQAGLAVRLQIELQQGVL
jgi:hypothetical protein